MTQLHVACVQLNQGADSAQNNAALEAQIRAAAAKGARLIVTPECSDLMLWPAEEKHKLSGDQQSCSALALAQDLATTLNVSIVLGSVSIKENPHDEKLWNRSFVINASGQIAAQYDKIHLFDVDLEGGESYRESNTCYAGNHAVIAQTQGIKLGMSICYDVRFAALYRLLAQKDAQILTVPAAFAVPTGRAHWEVLLRARAIETGSFVLAAGQTGQHPGGRSTYGHSMIISPWGEIIASMEGEVGLVDAVIDLDQVETCRKNLPALRHDKPFTLQD